MLDIIDLTFIIYKKVQAAFWHNAIVRKAVFDGGHRCDFYGFTIIDVEKEVVQVDTL